MALSDIQYFRDRGYRLAVQFRSDDGTWVDLNAMYPSSMPDYWRGLLREPTITVRSEDSSGIYAPAVDSLLMDNSPWQGHKYGFWDAYTPIVIRGKSFTQWMRRRVRLVLELYYANELQESMTLATCLIEGITRSNGTATIKLSSIARLLQTRSAETIKIGSDWARSWPIASLIRMIVQRTDPTITFAAGFGSTLTDLGTFDTPRCSSWGSSPGILSSGQPAVDHWIPRCFASDPTNTNRVYIGFECPGASDTSDGAIARFSLLTGQWDIIISPSDMVGKWPVSVWGSSGGTFIDYITIYDRDPSIDSTFYYLQYARYVLGSSISLFQSHSGYWPARETLRAGLHPDLWRIGHLFGVFWGEAAACPFPQVLDSPLVPNGSAVGYADHCGYRADAESDAATIPDLDGPLPLPVQSGMKAGYVGAAYPGSGGAGFRYFMGLQWHQPYLAKRGVNTFIQYIRLEPTTFTYQLAIYPQGSGTAIFRSFSTALGSPGAQLWEKQITAWAADPHSTTVSTDERVIIATIEWDETNAGTARWSTTKLIACRFPGTDTPTLTSLTIDAPSDGSVPAFARVIVALWTPGKGEPIVEPTVETADYCVGVVLNRASVQTPCYGIGIWRRALDTALLETTLYGSAGYTGPVSSMPFGGFVRDADDEQTFRFVDQATGQVWKCILDVSLTVPTWRLENRGQAAHSTEFALATINGGRAVLDSQPVYLWGMSPGPTGEVSVGYPLRSGAKPSWVRRVPGLYPLVQLSRKVADSVEVADFSGMTAWEVLKDLKQIAYNHVLYFDGSGALHFDERAESASVGSLIPIDMAGYVSHASTDIPVDAGFEVREGIDQVKNAVDVTPWGLQSAGDADQAIVSAAGSEWSGDYLYLVKTERPIRVAITCVAGGDVWSSKAVAVANQCAVLFRWQSLSETLHHYLAIQCGTTDTHVRVAGLTVKSSTEIYSGEVRIRMGDFLKVADGTTRTITAILSTASDYVDFALSGSVDVMASAYSEVTVEPQDSSIASDSENGITTLAVAYVTATPTALSVVDATSINVYSVIQVRTSYFIVSSKTYISATRTDLVVERLYFTTIPDANYPVGTPVKAYVYIAEVGKTFPVGATGISFGVQVDENTEAKYRCLSAGDGIVITAHGLRLGPLKQTAIRAINRDSIGDTASGTGYGRQDLSIKDNRFVDVVKADLLSQSVLTASAWPLTIASGIKTAIFPTITASCTVTVSDPRISLPDAVGGDQAASFEVTEIKYDISNGKQTMSLKAYERTPRGKAIAGGEGVEEEGMILDGL